MKTNHTMKTDHEMLLEQCQSVRDGLETCASGGLVRCGECGEWTEPGETCGECGAELYGDEETSDIYTYFEGEDIYNEDFTASLSGRGIVYRGASLMVAFGGPNVCIDTNTGNVEGYWWGNRASVPIRREAVEAVDDWVLERLQCSGLDIDW